MRGDGGALAAGHYLAAQVGATVLHEGGNAADAACAMGFALVVLEPTQNGLGGEVPILVWDASEERAFCVSGQGPAPAAAQLESLSDLPNGLIPHDGFLPAAIPGALDAWCQLLERFGSWPFERVVAPAQGIAARGFAMYPFLQGMLHFIAARFEKEWPSSAAIYLPVREIGERQTNPPLAAFFADLCTAAPRRFGSGSGHSRRPGPLLPRPGRRGGGALPGTAPARRHGRGTRGGCCAPRISRPTAGSVEEPARFDYRGNQVWKPPPWSQGPVFLQQLALLSHFDLAGMEPRGPDALHTWIEVAKLAFADREACYGDPQHVEVPLQELLSRDYNAARARLVDPDRASQELRPGRGQLPAGWPRVAEADARAAVEPQAVATAKGRNDTTQLVAADRHGNVIAATPSGGWIPSSPVIPELGFPMGTRLQMAVLDPAHPNALAPGKRPRTTLSPSLARLADGRVMAFGTPGGDQQDQWPAHFFHDLVDFGEPDLQTAIDRPTLHSEHMPSSFYPRNARPGAVVVEGRMPEGDRASPGGPRPPRAARGRLGPRPRARRDTAFW